MRASTRCVLSGFIAFQTATQSAKELLKAIFTMKNIIPALAATLMLYAGAIAAFYVSDRLNPSASDAGVGQSLVVLGVVGVVLLSAFLYAFYKAVAQDPRWWFVVGLHFVLGAIASAWMMR